MSVVTLFHFYCGLRHYHLCQIEIQYKTCSNPFPFLLWIATLNEQGKYSHIPIRSNPFPFLLWIATKP